MYIILVTSVIILSLAVLLRNYTGDWLHPAFTFPLTWGIVLLMCGVAELFGYLGVEMAAIPLFYIGISMFVVGALLGDMVVKKIMEPATFDLKKFNFNRLGWLCLVLHLICVPLSILEIRRITGGATDLNDIAFQLRLLSVTNEDVVNPLVGNYLVSGLVFMPILAIGLFRGLVSKIITGLAFLPWIVLSILVSGRSALISLVAALVYLYFISGKTLNLKSVVLFFTGFAFVIIVGAQLVGKTKVTADDGVPALVGASTENFFDYTLQGPILFSRYVAKEISIEPTWDALVFMSHIAGKFGMELPENKLHQDFEVIATDGRDGNVYSIFLSVFPKYGYLGTVVIFFVYGVWTAYHHVRSRGDASLVDMLLASYLFYAVVISCYLDAFGPALYFFIKLVIITKAVEYVCARKGYSRPHARPERT